MTQYECGWKSCDAVGEVRILRDDGFSTDCIAVLCDEHAEELEELFDVSTV